MLISVILGRLAAALSRVQRSLDKWILIWRWKRGVWELVIQVVVCLVLTWDSLLSQLLTRILSPLLFRGSKSLSDFNGGIVVRSHPHAQIIRYDSLRCTVCVSNWDYRRTIDDSRILSNCVIVHANYRMAWVEHVFLILIVRLRLGRCWALETFDESWSWDAWYELNLGEFITVHWGWINVPRDLISAFWY